MQEECVDQVVAAGLYIPGDGNSRVIQEERIRFLNERPVVGGRYVLYWMQASQRAEYNHALEYAVFRANELSLPLVAFFGMTGRFPEANERHYVFMLQGLREVRSALRAKGIRLVIRTGPPEKEVISLSRDAALLVTDRGYLSVQKKWRSYAADRAACPVVQVESEVVVPVEEASDKEEYAAATIRPKISRLLSRFLVPVRHMRPKKSSLEMNFRSVDIDREADLFRKLAIDGSVGRVGYLIGGTGRGKELLKRFINKKIDLYEDHGNDPVLQIRSFLSPYLHFGQISPLYAALQVIKGGSQCTEAFLEQLIIRRELSMNFVNFNAAYDSYDCLPEWARKSLELHSSDRRPYIYSLEQLEEGLTHDEYWNAAQDEMRITGSMHGYMRMYWGKKIIEWTSDPRTAFSTALILNNRYELDGRDPNGFTGVAWLFGKHDRAWKERPVFGKVRYMNDNGLKRKFDIGSYVEYVQKMKSESIG